MVAASVEGGMDVIFVEQDVGVEVGDMEVSDMGPIALLARANEDHRGVDEVSGVEQIVKHAVSGLAAREV